MGEDVVEVVDDLESGETLEVEESDSQAEETEQAQPGGASGKPTYEQLYQIAERLEQERNQGFAAAKEYYEKLQEFERTQQRQPAVPDPRDQMSQEADRYQRMFRDAVFEAGEGNEGRAFGQTLAALKMELMNEMTQAASGMIEQGVHNGFGQLGAYAQAHQMAYQRPELQGYQSHINALVQAGFPPDQAVNFLADVVDRGVKSSVERQKQAEQRRQQLRQQNTARMPEGISGAGPRISKDENKALSSLAKRIARFA